MATNTPVEGTAKTLGENEALALVSIPSEESEDEEWASDTSPWNDINLRSKEEEIVFDSNIDTGSVVVDVEANNNTARTEDRDNNVDLADRSVVVDVEANNITARTEDRDNNVDLADRSVVVDVEPNNITARTQDRDNNVDLADRSVVVDVEPNNITARTQDRDNNVDLADRLKALEEEMKKVKEFVDYSDKNEEAIPDGGLPFFVVSVILALGMLFIFAIYNLSIEVAGIVLTTALLLVILWKFGRALKDCSCSCSKNNRNNTHCSSCGGRCRGGWWRVIAVSILVISACVGNFFLPGIPILFFVSLAILILSFCITKIYRKHNALAADDPISFWKGPWISALIIIACNSLAFGIMVWTDVLIYDGTLGSGSINGISIGVLGLWLACNITAHIIFIMRLVQSNKRCMSESDATNEQVRLDNTVEANTSSDTPDSENNDVRCMDIYILLIGSALPSLIVYAIKYYDIYITLAIFLAFTIFAGIAKYIFDHFQKKDTSNSSSPDGTSSGSESTQDRQLEYPADSYSFLAYYSPLEQPNLFCFGLMVFIFQCTFLGLLITSIVSTPSDNPGSDWFANFMPANASSHVRAAQIVAIFAFLMFKDSNLDDITVALELYPKLFELDSMKKKLLALSSSLRMLQGMLSVVAVALLVMTSSEVIDIILNFTAINFVSNLDNIAFEVVESGKFGPTLEKAASNIKGKKLPAGVGSKSKHRRYMLGIAAISILLMIFIAAVATGQERGKRWGTEILKVQFDGERFAKYSGCYNRGDYSIDKRHIYKSSGSGVELQYCPKEQIWLFFEEKESFDDDYYYDSRYIFGEILLDPCKVLENKQEIAHSPPTDSYDISASFDELWFSSSNIPIVIYFLDSSTDDRLNESVCNALYPDHLKALTDLSYFDQFDRDISGEVTSEIGLLTSLNFFNLRDNDVTGKVPTDIGLLTDLTHLDLGYNDLTGSFPTEIGLLSGLTYIGLGGNPSLSVPNELFSLPLLSNIDLSGRGTNGSVTDALKGFRSELEYLDVSNNAFSDLGDIALLQDLTYLNIANNLFQGAIPKPLGGLTSLTSLDLSSNDVSDIIPLELGELRALENLNLSNNRLTGVLPWFIYFLLELSSLDLSNNALSGPIAISYVTPLKLSSLDLSNNKFTGTLDPRIGNLRKLEQLNLANNKLTGTLDPHIGNLRKLEQLNLANNKLTNTLGSWIGKLSELKQLNLANNRLTGTLGSWIGKLTELEQLNLANNNLNGTLHSQIAKLTNLEQLNFSNNSFTGTIPRAIRNMPNFNNFIFDENNLNG